MEAALGRGRARRRRNGSLVAETAATIRPKQHAAIETASWSPPYNVDTPESAKEQSIRGALEAIAVDLLVPIETIVPMRLDKEPPYNLEFLWLRLESVVGEAQQARWVRVLRTAIREDGWRRSLRQLLGAGRIVGEWVLRAEHEAATRKRSDKDANKRSEPFDGAL